MVVAKAEQKTCEQVRLVKDRDGNVIPIEEIVGGDGSRILRSC